MQPLVSRVSDLEYRTCAAASRAEAKTTAQRLKGLRQTAWRRRMDQGLGGPSPELTILTSRLESRPALRRPFRFYGAMAQ